MVAADNDRRRRRSINQSIIAKSYDFHPARRTRWSIAGLIDDAQKLYSIIIGRRAFKIRRWRTRAVNVYEIRPFPPPPDKLHSMVEQIFSDFFQL